MAAMPLLLLHLLSTAYMTGVIWFVQLVHYPLFILQSAETFPPFQRQNQFRTSLVVIPGMFVELGTGLLLLFNPTLQAHENAFQSIEFGFALLVVIWLSTFLVQVPLHGKLSTGHDQLVVKQLVRSNWLRTIAWSLRTALLCLAILLL